MSIHIKLLEFQKKNIKVAKDGSNPHFNSKYATLNAVLEKVKPELTKLGVLIIQNPEADGLRTKLVDTEDESFVESFLPYIDVTTAQKLGSCNTYNRRYSLVTMLGLEDEDDDGNVASAPSSPKASVQDEPLEDGMLEVNIIRERHDEKDGRPWQKVVTDIGSAWNNTLEDGGELLVVGVSYSVVVKNGRIITASEL